MAQKEKTAGPDTARVAGRVPVRAAKSLLDCVRIEPKPDIAPALAAVGTHLIADFWGARHLTDAATLEKVLCAAVAASKATLLHIHLHRFNEGDGVTGVALLAESHISMHTWPEHDYAAFDIFMCGDCDPLAALQVLRQQLEPVYDEVHTIARGARPQP